MGQSSPSRNVFSSSFSFSFSKSSSMSLHGLTEKPFSNHFLNSKPLKPVSLPSYSINLDNYIEMETPPSFYIYDSATIKLRKVRHVNDKDQKECFTMKYIIIKDDQTLKQYLNEADILCGLEHENVVRFRGYGVKTEKNNLKKMGILTEFFENNLDKVIKERISKTKFFTKDELTSIIHSLISGLLYLHSKRIYHANIHSENLLIAGDRHIKFSNFCFSHDVSNDRSTLLGDMAGTEQTNNWSLFWSPEFKKALMENKCNFSFNAFKVDSFALGLLILQIASLYPIDEIYKYLESSSERNKLYKLIESQYNKGIGDLIKDLMDFDEDERKTVLSVCFAPKKSYEELVSKQVFKTYNIQRTDRKQYKSLEFLGSGGFGEVKSVKSLKSQEKLAEKSIKMIDSRCLIDAMEEVLINASMEHENIVKFFSYDIEETPNRSDFFNIYCYTELMDHALDYEIVRRSKLTPKAYFSIQEVNDFLYSMAKAMKYLQEVKNTAHCDVKPHNILMTADMKTYKLCDFGISRSNLPIDSITRMRTIQGSPLFIAPELKEDTQEFVSKTKFNPFKADIFSLGLSLYYMLTLEGFSRNKERERENCFRFFVSEHSEKKILERYDAEILELLKDMLKYDFCERMDYLGFYRRIYESWKLRNKEINKEKYAILKKTPKKEGKQFEAIYQENLEMLEKMEDYEEMAYLLFKLGNLYKKSKKPEVCLSYFEKSLELACKTLGFDHPNIAPILNNLGVIYLDLGDCVKAKSFFLQASEILRRNPGQKDEKVLVFKLNMGSSLVKSGDLAEALKVYQHCLDMAIAFYSEESVEVAKILEDVASALRKFKTKEKNEEALKNYQKSLKILESAHQTQTENQRRYVETLWNLIKTHIDLKNWDEVKLLIDKSIKFHQEIFGMESKPMGLCYNQLAFCYSKMGNFKQALENRLKADDIFEALFLDLKKKRSPQIKAESYSGRRLKETEEKSQWITSSHFKDMIKSYFGGDLEKKSFLEMSEMDYVSALNSTGILHREMKNLPKARVYFQKAWDILKGLKEKKDYYLNMAEVLNNLGAAMIELGKEEAEFKIAKKFLEEGINALRKINGQKINQYIKVLVGNLAVVEKKLRLIKK